MYTAKAAAGMLANVHNPPMVYIYLVVYFQLG
jgi:hypothetical protein